MQTVCFAAKNLPPKKLLGRDQTPYEKVNIHILLFRFSKQKSLLFYF